MLIRLHGKRHYRPVSGIICGLLCLVWVGLAGVPHANGQGTKYNGKRVHKHARAANHLETEVLYYDRSDKMGVVKRDDKIFEVRFLKGDAYEWNELEGYPEGLPNSRTHVERYPEKINTIEADSVGPPR